MQIEDLWNNYYNVVEGGFDNLSAFNFSGVYVLCDKSGKVMYIGSAYARTIQIRLKQYLSATDSGNTLGKTIAKKLANSPKYDDNARLKIHEAIKIIKKLKIYAVEHSDLEYKLINIAKPQYNNMGKAED